LKGFILPPRSAYATDLREKIGAGAAFVVIVALAVMALLLFRRQRELAQLREQVGVALAVDARARITR
jgi:hypothetical protein